MSMKLGAAKRLASQVCRDPVAAAEFASKSREWCVAAGAVVSEAVAWVCGLAVMASIVDAIERMASS